MVEPDRAIVLGFSHALGDVREFIKTVLPYPRGFGAVGLHRTRQLASPPRFQNVDTGGRVHFSVSSLWKGSILLGGTMASLNRLCSDSR